MYAERVVGGENSTAYLAVGTLPWRGACVSDPGIPTRLEDRAKHARS